MSPKTPVIQVLSRQNYADQHLISLPDALPLPALAPSSIRVVSTILSLTTNNLTYALIGHLLGWWDVYPLPPSIPKEFSDPKAYGRISAWGFATVLESNTSIPVGTQVYGYLPIGTLPVDMLVEMKSELPDMFVETSKHRAHLLKVYNRYFLHPPAAGTQSAAQKQSQGYDALTRLLFETGYMINRFAFSWNQKELVHPSGAGVGWSFEDAQVAGSTVLVFSASGKTALALAHQLRHARPVEQKPKAIVGIGSPASRDFMEKTGFYDQVLEYSEDGNDLESKLGLKADSKIVLVDFGSRDGATIRWFETLKLTHKNVLLLGVGGELAPKSPDKATESFLIRSKASSAGVNASGLRDGAMEILGINQYFEDSGKAWGVYKEALAKTPLKLVWADGMEALGNGWQRLCQGDVSPNEGLIFDLNSAPSEKL